MSAAPFPQRVLMVKKRLASGEPCAKCVQAEELLKRRKLWDRIDEVVWADESDPESAGMRLARQYDVAVAPFFLVQRGDAEKPTVLTSALHLVKELTAEAASGTRPQPAQPTAAAPIEQAEVEARAKRLAGAEPAAILDWVLARLGTACGLAFSGAEDVVLIDMAVASGRPFSVFCLDTGRLHPETYRFIDRVRKHYGIEIELMSPDSRLLEPLVRKKGLFSFFEDGHAECCGVRKVEPLRRKLSTLQGWVTGQRRDQSPTRSEVPQLLWDTSHKAEGMLKANPLAHWSQAQVWAYIRERDVPYNELHERGYVSIGCEPCTRPVRPGEHERAGRWWWEEATQRECGLHKK